MRRVFIIILMILATLLSAKEYQFYMIGKFGRLGSVSNVASSQKGVYLKWDMLEGDLPKEISKINLIREVQDSNKTLLEFGTNDIKSVNEINALYKNSEYEREFYSILEALSKNDNLACSNVNISNFATKVRSCISSDKMWSFLASKRYFSIALIRNRAYLDKSINNSWGTIRYYLVAKSADGNKTITLGKVEVDLNSPKEVLPPKNFKQIISSKCNDNRFALDDFRVALWWQNGGDSKSEKFINNLLVAGYDIYYSTKPIDKLSSSFKSIDIAKLAQKVPHNSKGEIDLSSYSLAKANKTLITIKGSESNDSQPLYLETKKELIKRGFLAGEKRYYFLVAKDFTGNYTNSLSLEVTIPDLLPPEKPINPIAVENNGSIELMWQKPNLKNYSEHYKNTLKVCIAQSFRKINRYRFVDENENCSYDNGIEVNFNVDKFYVYRFKNFNEAAKFSDSDLDGYSDMYENNVSTNSCDANSHPNIQSKNHLIGVVDNNKQSDFVKFKDTTISKGQIYWYKIVSVTSSGISSLSTVPIRAYVPERGLKAAPKIRFKRLDSFKVKLEINNKTAILVRDETNLVQKITINTGKGVYELEKNKNEFSLPEVVINQSYNGRDYFTLYFYDNSDDLIYKYKFLIQDLIQLQNTENGIIEYVKNRAVLIQEGEFIEDFTKTGSSCFKIEYDSNYLQELQNNKSCIEVSEFIGNKRYRTKRICNIEQNQKICSSMARNGDMISYRFSEYNEGVYSQPRYLNVIYIDSTKVPSKVQLGSLEIFKDDKKIKTSLTYGLEKVSSIYLTLYKKGDSNTSYSKIISPIKSDRIQEYNETFSNLTIKEGDIWCAKAKAIGINKKVSKWSTPICKEVDSVNVSGEDIMPWPNIENGAIKKEDRAISFDSNKKRVLIKLSSYEAPSRDYEICKVADAIHTIPKFIVYRQTLFNDGTKSKFVQVSPLIDPTSASCDEKGNFQVNDPNIDISASLDNNNLLDIYFVDRYPMVAGQKYKYLILYLDSANKEFTSYAATKPSIISVP